METLQITKRQARIALTEIEWINEDLKRRGNIKEAMCWYSNITMVDGHYYYNSQHTKTEYSYKENDKYTYEINPQTMQLFDCFTINNVDINVDECKNMFKDDLTESQQSEFLSNLDLTQVEEYLSKRTGVKIELTKNKFSPTELEIISQDLTDKSGVCKAMFKSLYIRTFGKVYFYIDKNSGEQCLSIPSFHFSYTHVDGGSNGAEMGKVRYNIKKNVFMGYNYEKDEYEII